MSVTNIAEDNYIIHQLDSMLLPANDDGDWQGRAREMTRAVVAALAYKCRREGIVMSVGTVQAYLPLRAMANLYIQSVEQQWPEETRLPLENYLNRLVGFDLAKVDSPSQWAPEPLTHHGYLIQSFTR